ncbi:PIN domain-containing protein [Nostoc sp. NMS1]|uniref:PIN domain-containing protein n=1 Tax=Nostoc sp. NMS1 TaxID=2815388 RepID=UPI0025D819CC|nr:PIN domain-containing protein [Nostoc sp. NMS1]
MTEAVLAGKIYADLETTGKRIGYPDCMIAAIAISHNLTLVTGTDNCTCCNAIRLFPGFNKF